MNLDQLAEEIAAEEGFRPFVYDDANDQPIEAGSHVVGNPTIGYGWNVAASPMSTEEARTILANRIRGAALEAARLVPNFLLLDDVRQDVLIDMCFNMGAAKLSGFHLMLAAANDRNYPEWAKQMEDSAWWNEVGSRGPILQRRVLTGVA